VRAARRRALESPLERALLVVCVGCLAAWSVHTSVDWMHLLPGITAVPLIAMGVLLRRGRETAPRRSWGPRRRAAIVATAAIVAAIAATSLTRSALADWFRSRAQSALVNSPADSLKWANRSLRLDPDSPSTYYIKAAALARFGAGSDAERVLQTAIDREPGNFLSYALLGDLYTREGKTSLAKHAYGNAFARNPLEPGLARLAGRPAAGGTPPSP
jgi:tetratricopeptide (TPR) repeat protein